MRILVADDEPSVRVLLRRILEGAGHEVLEARDGAKALEQVAAHDVDLVLTDVMMPVMNGLELIRALRADAATASMPIIVVSAEYEVEALPVQAAVAKPFVHDEVLAAVHGLTGSAG
jgi:CheY-like chemotaxis protein